MAHSKLRRLWLALHLYLGLTVGLVFALAGLTGSLLVFYVEIDRMVNPELVVKAAGSTPQPLSAVVLALQQHQPQRTHAWRLELPSAQDRPVMARYMKPDETAHAGFAPLLVAVDPYTLNIISHRFWGDFAMTWIYDLHYTLLLDKPGKTVMGVIGLACLISLLTGMYLWWPRHGHWRRALALKLRHGAARKVYDIHTLSGVYGGILLLMLVVTGVVLELPHWFHPLLNHMSPLYQPPVLASAPFRGVAPISADAAAGIASSRFPHGQLRWLETPDGERGVYRVQLRQQGEPGNRFPRTTVWIEQYSGSILAVRNPRNHTAADVFLDWQHPLHSGEAFGLTGRLLVFFSGLLPAVMLVTGWLRWRQKQRVKHSGATTSGLG